MPLLLVSWSSILILYSHTLIYCSGHSQTYQWIVNRKFYKTPYSVYWWSETESCEDGVIDYAMTRILNLVKFRQLTQILDSNIHRYVFLLSPFTLWKKGDGGQRDWALSYTKRKMLSWFMTPFTLVGIKTNEEHFAPCAGIAQSVTRLATVRGSNSGGGRDFPRPSRKALRHTQPPIQWVPGLSRG